MDDHGVQLKTQVLAFQIVRQFKHDGTLRLSRLLLLDKIVNMEEPNGRSLRAGLI